MTYIQAVGGSDPVNRAYGSGASGAIHLTGATNLSSLGSDINCTTFLLDAGQTLTVDRSPTVIRATTSIDIEGLITGAGHGWSGAGVDLSTGQEGENGYGPGAGQGGSRGDSSTSGGRGGGGGGMGTAGSAGTGGQTPPSPGPTGAAGGTNEPLGLFFLANDTALLNLGGSGGGGGGGDSDGDASAAQPTAGGAGGAILILIAPTITFGSGALVTLAGADGTHGIYPGSNVTGSGGGGGGSGGALGLIGETINFPGSGTSITCPGGQGGSGGDLTAFNGGYAPGTGPNPGGSGGTGRVAILYKTAITTGYASRVTNAVVTAING